MNVVRWLQPRDHARAARTISTLGMVAAGVTIAFAIVQPGTRESGQQRMHTNAEQRRYPVV